MPAPAVARTDHGDFERCTCDRCSRARIAWRQRDHLARVARRRTTSWVDAEDAAQEAIVRALEAPELDCEQLPGWLTRVAMNVCADAGRDQRRHHKRVRYQVIQEAAEPDVESVVVERAYARAMYSEAMALPPAQRAAMLLKAEGRSVMEVAEALAISPKAAESLLSRARATLRRAATAIAAVTLVLVRRARRSVPPLAATATAVSSILVFAPASGGPAPVRVVALPPGSARAAVSTQVMPARHAASVAVARRVTTRAASAGHAAVARRDIVAPRDVAVGPARVHDGGEGWTHLDESLTQSVQECVDQGVVVTAAYVGCKAAEDSKDAAVGGVKQS